MSAVFPPNQTTTIMVSTLVSSKIIYLPAISTIQPGKFFCIKDANGNAFRSSIFISTTGLDTIEYNPRPSTLYALLSTNYGAVVLMPDTRTNWAVLQQYTTNAM